MPSRDPVCHWQGHEIADNHFPDPRRLPALQLELPNHHQLSLQDLAVSILDLKRYVESGASLEKQRSRRVLEKQNMLAVKRASLQ